MSKKKTIIEMYEEIKAVPGLSAEQIAFLDKRIEITQKKNAKSADGERKPTKLQLENENIKVDILSALGGFDKAVSISDLQKSSADLADFSPQKIAALLTQLLNEHKVVRTEVKGRAYFALATED
jgi:hypothetical protein